MSRYFSSNSSPDNIIDCRQPNDDAFGSSSSMAGIARYGYGNSTASIASVLSQSRCFNQNNRDVQNKEPLTWNISLTDDQDEISEKFLKMRDEPTTAIEKFGPAMSMVPVYVRKQADELFKPSEINPNEIFDMANNTRASWILPSGYQQYIQSVPRNVLEKRERHVLYPWTQWNTSTGARHRPSPNSNVGSPAASGRSPPTSSSSSSSSLLSSSSPSSSSSSPSSLYVHRPSVRSPESGTGNSPGHGNLSGYGSGAVSAAATDTSSASGDVASGCPPVVWTAREQQQNSPYTTPPRYACSTPTGTNSGDASATPVHSPSRLYYCVNADTNTINKLVEHYCTFCYKNHEPPEVYGSHLLRDSVRTTCPKLRALKCKHCNGTGDNAHTIKYCPFVYANYK